MKLALPLHRVKEMERNVFITFSLIHASSLSTFLLNSCRFLAPPSALVWFAAVCFRVCHWSLSWLSCFFTRSEVGFSLQINCSPIFWRRKKHEVLAHFRYSTDGRPDWHSTVAEYIWHLRFVIDYVPADFTNAGKMPIISLIQLWKISWFCFCPSWAVWVSAEVNYQQCTISKHVLLREKV